MRNRIYRKIYEQYYGPIPKGYHIHHKDGNHSNNDADNLEAVTAKEHYDIHYRQGDFGACWAMWHTGHMTLTSEEKSSLMSKNALKRAAAGTHPFQSGEAQRNSHRERLANGTHHLLTNHPNKIIVTCPHCGKSGSKPHMMRYHFDKCKQI